MRYVLHCMRAVTLLTTLLGLLGLCFQRTTLADEPRHAIAPVEYTIDLTTAQSGFDGTDCWVHARAGIIPPGSRGNPGMTPLVVITTQKLLLSGSDVFYPLHEILNTDLGSTWTKPREIPTMRRQRYVPGQPPLPTGAAGYEHLLQEGDETLVCDFTPQWHAASQSLLGIGHTVWYRNNSIFSPRPRATAYAVRDSESGEWSHWKTLKLPDSLSEFSVSGAGCVQRCDLPDGTILLPIYGRGPEAKRTRVTVLRCRFDGETLSYLSHGTILEVPSARGLAEPSITRYGDRYFLTLRHDERGYVSVSSDGQTFPPPVPWTFDDGTELGNYNTQQHWVTHSDGLFLVYTRRGANNDHVFRHRAPLFMAQVDPDRLCVLRATERAIVPERGARLGNFGVVDVSPDETWIIAAEWMQPRPPKGMPEKYGSDNSIFVSRIRWKHPNALIRTK